MHVCIKTLYSVNTRQYINQRSTLDQTSPSSFFRLKEKIEIEITKLSNRVTDQDKVINLCQQNIRRLQEENLNLKSCIFELEGKMSLVKGVNEMSALKQQASDDKGWLYIDNSHIRVEHLKYNNIHLNKVGVKLLASNYIRQALRPLNGSKGSTTVNFSKPVWELAKALNRMLHLT